MKHFTKSQKLKLFVNFDFKELWIFYWKDAKALKVGRPLGQFQQELSGIGLDEISARMVHIHTKI